MAVAAGAANRRAAMAVLLPSGLGLARLVRPGALSVPGPPAAAPLPLPEHLRRRTGLLRPRDAVDARGRPTHVRNLDLVKPLLLSVFSPCPVPGAPARTAHATAAGRDVAGGVDRTGA